MGDTGETGRERWEKREIWEETGDLGETRRLLLEDVPPLLDPLELKYDSELGS